MKNNRLYIYIIFFQLGIIFSAENIAKNKKWTGSDSNPQYAAGFWAGLTDGNLDDNNKNSFATGSGGDFPKQVIIDLAGKYQIESIKVYNSREGGTKTVEVLISDDNENYLSAGKNIFTNYDPGIYEISFIKQNTARFVKIVFPDKYPVGFKNKPANYLFLREIEIYGKLAGTETVNPDKLQEKKQESALPTSAVKIYTLGSKQINEIAGRNYPYKTITNVVYGQNGTRELKMDILVPEDGISGEKPAMLFIPGSGWKEYDKAASHDAAAEYAGLGFIVFITDYRLSEETPVAAAIADAKCAVRFIRARADKYNIDVKRLTAAGDSSGAYLALMAGLCNDKKYEGTGGNNEQPSTVNAVISRWGITDVYDITYGLNKTDYGKIWIKPETGDREQFVREMSPVNYAKGKDLPPVFSIHGSEDEIVPFYHALKLHVLLTQNKHNSELFIYPGGNHGCSRTKYKCIQEEVKERCKIALVSFLVKNKIL